MDVEKVEEVLPVRLVGRIYSNDGSNQMREYWGRSAPDTLRSSLCDAIPKWTGIRKFTNMLIVLKSARLARSTRKATKA